MKKNIAKKGMLLGLVTVGALAVGALSMFFKQGTLLIRTRADKTYVIDAFSAVKSNLGATVNLTTENGNHVDLSTSGVTVSGNKLVVAPGGYLEIARDETKELKNAIDGLRQLTTDFVGRISYSYRDKAITYDEKVNGANFSFPTESSPSFFKLYNDGDQNVEVGSLGINYSCTTSEESFIPAYGSARLALNDGVISSTGNQVSLTLLREAKKGILEYTILNAKTSLTAYVGPVVGLETTKSNWYYSNATYVWGVLGATGCATFATVDNSSEEVLFEGDTASNHLINGYVANQFTTLTLKFDVDAQYYALYCGNQLMAADTTAIATGSKIGFRLAWGGTQVKNVVLKTGVDFVKETLQRRTKNQFNVYNDGTSNVYEGTNADSWHYFKEELPATGTITFDYRADSFASNWVEGLMFAESTDINSVTNPTGRAAVFGTGKTSSQFNGVVFHKKVDSETSEESYDTSWIGSQSTRKGRFAYTLGTLLHMRVDYDLTNYIWTFYTRDDENSAWVLTGTDGNFSTNTQDVGGLKYLGVKTASSHVDGEKIDVTTFNTTISNLVVNGVAW